MAGGPKGFDPETASWGAAGVTDSGEDLAHRNRPDDPVPPDDRGAGGGGRGGGVGGPRKPVGAGSGPMNEGLPPDSSVWGSSMISG